MILLLRRVLKGKPTTTLSRELGLAYQTVWEIRHDLHDNACWLHPTTLLEDTRTETVEMFQNAGEKVSPTATQTIHPACGPTSDGGGGPTPVTGLLS